MRGNILATENQQAIINDVIEVDTGGPVWKLGSELAADEFLPTPEELEDLKNRLRVELDKLLEREKCLTKRI